MTETNYKFDTLQVHAGSSPDPVSGARQTPIYQNTAYVFKDASHAASLFNLEEVGYIYSRLNNPTVSALQDRLSALEGAVGAVCCSSGHSAQIMALLPLMEPGDNIIASNRLYGGSINQLSNFIKKFNWSAQFVDLEDLDSIKKAFNSKTKAIFCESISNPGGYVTDINEIAKIANEMEVPLIVDNTSATPYLCKPFDFGANIVTHSTTKYLSGNGTSLGGAVLDNASFDWSKTSKYPSLSEPESGYHGLKFHETFGDLAFTFYGIAISLRDLGMAMAPQHAFQTLLGIETLSLRMKKHVENTQVIASWLERDDRIGIVNYAGLRSSPFSKRVKRQYPNGAGGLFTFTIRGGYDACVKFVDNLKVFSHVANLGDTRSLVIHPASTTHRQLSEEQQKNSNAGPDLVRLSIGIEDSEDLIKDIDQALDKSMS